MSLWCAALHDKGSCLIIQAILSSILVYKMFMTVFGDENQYILYSLCPSIFSFFLVISLCTDIYIYIYLLKCSSGSTCIYKYKQIEM